MHAQMVGGAFLLQIEHYKKLNGYSNKYFGWGQEDDDMYERVRFVFKDVKHIDQKFGNVSPIHTSAASSSSCPAAY